MSKEIPPIDWDKIWDEYNKALKAWISVFETFQESTRAVQSLCNDLIAKALEESKTYSMSKFAENWQKSMSDMGFNTSKQFGDNWQNVFNESALEQLKTYGETLKKFSEAYSWFKMWNK